MFSQSIRWKLPLTYAAIAALAAACLGVALLTTLGSYYMERERLHLENNALAVSRLVQRFQTNDASVDEMAAQIGNLAFITQARIRVVTPQNETIVDTGSPSNTLTFSYIRADAPDSAPVTITAQDIPDGNPVDNPVSDMAGDLPDSPVSELMVYGDPNGTIDIRSANEPGSSETAPVNGADTADLLSAPVGDIIGPGSRTIRLSEDGMTLWMSSAAEGNGEPITMPLHPPDNGPEPIPAGRLMNRPYSFSVAATPYGFDLIGEMDFDMRSTQVVRLPLNALDGMIAGYVELSEGASFGAQIMENVTIALIFAEGLAILIAGLVGWIISRQISQPVLSLTVGAEQMARGQLETRVKVSGRDEFGKLALTFNEMAEQVEVTVASLRRFVADAAHELHTPLTALYADLELAMTDSDEKRRLSYVARARAQVHLLEQLTDNLLDLSRLEAKTRQMPFHPVNVTQMVHALSESAASRAEQLNLQFTIEAPDTPVYVIGDEMQLRRAVGNLLDNAIKFTPEGGTVGIAVQPVENSVKIVVNDTGIGIPADELPQLFSRFHRGRNASHVPGSGLGLAIIRAIVDGHRGQIEVFSRPGATQFTMRLPASTTIAAAV